MWEALRPYQKLNTAPPVARARHPTQGAEAKRQDDPPRRDQSALKNATVARNLNSAVLVESEDERAEFLRKHQEAMWEAFHSYLGGNRVAQAAGAPVPAQGVDAFLESKKAVKEQCVRKDAEAVTRLQTQDDQPTWDQSALKNATEARKLKPPVLAESEDERAEFSRKHEEAMWEAFHSYLGGNRVAQAAGAPAPAQGGDVFLGSERLVKEQCVRKDAEAVTRLQTQANKSQPLFEAPAAFHPGAAKLQATPQRPPPGGPLSGGPPAEARSAPAISREVCAAKPVFQRRQRYMRPGSSTKKKPAKLLATVKEESECDFLEEDTDA